MRFQGKSRLGFYPLPMSEAQRIRRFLLFPDLPSSALDPCVGDGVAFEAITCGAEVFRYGIELDAYRAEQARQRIPNIVQGNTLEVQCAVECFGLLYLNPPYDWTLGPADSRRTEQTFLSHTYRWLKPAGILVLVIPSERLSECGQILSTHFRDVRVHSTDCARGIADHLERIAPAAGRPSCASPQRLFPVSHFPPTTYDIPPTVYNLAPFFSTTFPLSTCNHVCFVWYSGFALDVQNAILCFQ